ncbi:phosphoribosylamine--glycine ligase [Reichenbachiella agariperforans]|uniref:Phosphoribosylamine--glycine ligase n=1 Tax=Reichenbachiella agariperforans TaxID=156994 RepID=A0A1M6NLW8_REIAG|nr:phosphoribosylamine--glycine ligase [Reichenbachiella agariperforans]MBU2915928.1 phosphoribosylamine--glycine ligase [Reichenbachiella agariperforans]SHJ96626.1 phosphoribosylamine--glycine ligase [Reichenbachiella agariperforans]
MNVLVIGSGGREHTLIWKIKQSALCDTVYAAPGNAGTADIATNLDLGVNDFEQIGQAVLDNNIELVIVGPEEPLVKGIRNYFASTDTLKDILLVGPDETGARLEGSKDFSKDFMQRHGVPTAGSKTITKDNIAEGKAFLKQVEAPYVLKADGLAAGKGVIITEDIQEAEDTLDEMLAGKFGDASSKVLIEEYLHGIELSVFVLTDGKDYLILPEAKDYKRIGEGDTGPNTGGMGAVSPVPFADAAFMKNVEEKVIIPTVKGLEKDNIDYVGFIFIGLMNKDSEPSVIEYNVRMGDPETEVVLPRIKSDLLQHLIAAAKKDLKSETIEVGPETATTVVAVSAGYPGSYPKGLPMTGFEEVSEGIVFHAGTKQDGQTIVTNGGRVLASTALASSIQGALDLSYANLKKITWEGMTYRKDIGQDLLNYKS